jgi:CDP-glucose 4,6-dehydratase
MTNCFDNVYKSRRVLVTGHTGFKGSWLALWLLQMGAEVAGYSSDVPTSPANFELLGLKSRLHDYRGDTRNRVRLAEVIDEFRPEMIFHLAAQSLVRRSYADPVTTFETNVMGMVNLLDCVRARSWIKAAVLITSDKVYQNNEWCWGYRETDTLAGRDPYSGSKSCADLVAHTYFHSFLKSSPMQMATTRAGNVIGGGDWADDRIVPDCIRAWSQQSPAIIRNPSATRPWQHVLEPLSGYLLLGAGLWQQRSGLNGEAFNFGPDSQVNQSVGELLDAMRARWPGAQWNVSEDCDQNRHEATLLKLSCDKALIYLNWRPALQFQQTVALTVDWYRQWDTKESDIYKYSVDQIQQYCRSALTRGLCWIKA